MLSRRSAQRCVLSTVASAVLVLALGGCSSGQSDDEQKAADALAKQILSVGSTGTQAVTEKQAHCVGDGTVHDVGLDRLQHYGIISKDLTVNKSVANVKMTETDADHLAKVFATCLDSERLVEQQFISGSTVTPKQKQCVRDAIDQPATLQILSRSFQGQNAADVYAGVRKDLKRCAKLKK
jgi:hypothetical protein